MHTTFSSAHKSASISINFQVPQGWHELDDAQLRYVYSLIAKEFSADEIKTLALLKWATPKVRGYGLENSLSSDPLPLN